MNDDSYEIIPLAKAGDQRSVKKENIKRDKIWKKECFKTSMKLRMRKSKEWMVRKDVRVSLV